MVAAPEHLGLQVRRDAHRPKRWRRRESAACIQTKIGKYIGTTPSITMRRHSVFARCRCGMCPLICYVERSHATNVTEGNNGRGDEAWLRPRLAHAEDRRRKHLKEELPRAEDMLKCLNCKSYDIDLPAHVRQKRCAPTSDASLILAPVNPSPSGARSSTWSAGLPATLKSSRSTTFQSRQCFLLRP